MKEKKADIRTGGDGNRSEMVIVGIDHLIPALVHEKPWSARKEAYQTGLRDGRIQQDEFWRKHLK